MFQRTFWRAVLIVVISLALPAPARPNSLDNAGRNIVIGIVSVTAAVAVVSPLSSCANRKKTSRLRAVSSRRRTG
jgi:hypothetical protein